MTDKELLRTFAWLCGELRAGNQFSNTMLLQWEIAAQKAVRTSKPVILTRDQHAEQNGPFD